MIIKLLGPLLLLGSVIFLAEAQSSEINYFERIPGNVPSAMTVQQRFFNPLNQYMVYVASKSDVQWLENGCREYQFYNQGFSNSKRIRLKMCIDRLVTPGSIEETVFFYIDDNYYGANKILRRGQNLSQTNDEDLYMWLYPKVSENTDLEISMEPDGIQFSHYFTPEQDSFKLLFKFVNFQMNIDESRTEDKQIRRFLITCESFCNGNVSEIKVVTFKNISAYQDFDLRYYADSVPEDVTPQLFFTLLQQLIFKPTGQLLGSIQSSHSTGNWPKAPRAQ